MNDVSSSIGAVRPGRVAVVTGAASGIGLAAARRWAQLGMKVVLADRNPETLAAARAQVAALAADPDDVRAVVTDVANFDDVNALAQRAAALGEVTVLMNNAGTSARMGKAWQDLETMHAILDVNLWGIIHGVGVFAPSMIERAEPAVIINTGSKQGLTLPPGNPAYNLSKAGVRAYTEMLAHDLRGVAGGAVSAHLLLPGFTHTGMTARGADKPAAAWTPDQVVDFMLEALARQNFYILCADNETPRALDERRIAWHTDDLIRNRPALSRWHPDHQEAFAAYLK
jgi:NAD(P)-dependent dehydrogenase (short-subunit alcohol dehydrogenase family)